MKFESPFPLSASELPPKLPELPKEEFHELSPQEVEERREELSTLNEYLESLWSGNKAEAGYQACEELYTRLLREPQYLRQAMRYPETRIPALYILNSVQGFSALAENSEDHYAERGFSDYQKLLLLFYEAMRDEEKSIELDLQDERNEKRGMILARLSDMLDSPVVDHREYSEGILMQHLPLLKELIASELDDSFASHIAIVWQRILLRMESNVNFVKAWAALQQAWESVEDKDWNILYQKILSGTLRSRSKVFEMRRDMIAAEAIGLTGLDGYKVLNHWILADVKEPKKGVESTHQGAYRKNLEALYALKQVSPEAPRELYERYGIAHFGRYTPDTLMSQYEERDLQENYGTVIFPYADHNGAFFQDGELLDSLQKELRKNGYLLRIVEAGSRSEVAKRVLRLDQTYGSSEEGHKIEFAIIGGHGTKESIQFGDRRKPGGNIRLEDISGERLTEGAKTLFVPGASIVLFSCSTGAREGMAEEMFKRYGWKLKAPEKDAAIQSITVTFDTANKPQLEVSYVLRDERIETMSYGLPENKDSGA